MIAAAQEQSELPDIEWNLSGWFVETHLKIWIVTVNMGDINAINSNSTVKGLISIIYVVLRLSSENPTVYLIVYSLSISEMCYHCFKRQNGLKGVYQNDLLLAQYWRYMSSYL